MKTILLIGHNGYVAKNIYEYFSNDYNFINFGREHNKSELDFALDSADYIVHTASKQKLFFPGDNFEDNINLTKYITDRCSSKKLIFCSSIHSKLDSPFGRVKRLEEDYIKSNSKNYQILVIPHTFGKYGLPNYNNFFNTLLYNFTNRNKISFDINDHFFNLLPISTLGNYISFDDSKTTTFDFYTHRKSIIEFLYDISNSFNRDCDYYRYIQDCLRHYKVD